MAQGQRTQAIFLQKHSAQVRTHRSLSPMLQTPSCHGSVSKVPDLDHSFMKMSLSGYLFLLSSAEGMLHCMCICSEL